MDTKTPANPFATREVTTRLLQCDVATIERIAAEMNLTTDQVLTMAVATFEDAQIYRRETGALLPWERDRQAAGLDVLE